MSFILRTSLSFIPGVYALDDTQSNKICQQITAAIADKRQINPGDRQNAERHANIYKNLHKNHDANASRKYPEKIAFAAH